MSVKMILHDGPLDGQQQLVGALATTPGSKLYISKPSHQTFAPDGVTVTSLGLEEVYVLVGQGPAPNPANGDTWDSSWIYTFAGEKFVAPPPLVVVPPVPPMQLAFVALSSETQMIINASDPVAGPSQVVLVGETTLGADLGFTPSASVAMEAVTVFQAAVNPDTFIFMGASTSMTVNPS